MKSCAHYLRLGALATAWAASACGGDAETDLFDDMAAPETAGAGGVEAGGESGLFEQPRGGATGSPAGAGGTTVGAGGTTNATGGAGGAVVAGCTEGMAQLCQCATGPLGSQICEGGVWTACGGCDADAACVEGTTQPCPCLPSGTGSQTCFGGVWGACEACPAPPPTSGTCPAPLLCLSSAFGNYCSEPGTPLPPFCPADGDCSALAGFCAVTSFGAYCLSPCTP